MTSHSPCPSLPLGRRPGKDRSDEGWAYGRHKQRVSECDSEMGWGHRGPRRGSEQSLGADLIAHSPREPASARAHAQLEGPRQIAETRAERRQVDVLGRSQREALPNGGEVEEELHSRDSPRHSRRPAKVGGWEGEIR